MTTMPTASNAVPKPFIAHLQPAAWRATGIDPGRSSLHAKRSKHVGLGAPDRNRRLGMEGFLLPREGPSHGFNLHRPPVCPHKHEGIRVALS